MTFKRKLIGLCFAVQFDLAMGLIAAYVLSRYFDRQLTIFTCLVAMFMALLPDFDTFLEKSKTGQVTGSHKGLLHYPAVVVLLAVVLVGIMTQGSVFWMSLAGVSLLAHYAHDTVEPGPGIGWLEPFVADRFRIHPRDGTLHFRLTKSELEIQNRITMEEWLEAEFLRPTPNLVSGFVVMAIALILIISARPSLY